MSNEHENKEWLNEYPTLKQVSPVNAFRVPVNYFEEMEGCVMDTIRLQQYKLANPEDGFAIPDGYFDNLTTNIQSRIAINEVLSTDKGFTVPQNYFDELSGNIQSRIAIDELTNAQIGFAVPENYFDELSGNIQSRIAIDELLNAEKGFAVPENYFEELSGNIQSRIAIDELLNTEQGFTVPENYFENMEGRILQNTIGTSAPSKTDSAVVRKLWATAAFKYASAACFALFVGAAIFITEFNDKAIHNRSDLHKALAKVSNSDLENYVELTGDSPTVLENSDPNDLSNLVPNDPDQGKIN